MNSIIIPMSVARDELRNRGELIVDRLVTEGVDSEVAKRCVLSITSLKLPGE